MSAEYPVRLPLGASVGARAQSHFNAVLEALRPLAEALSAVELRMDDLAREYKALFAPCGLVLFRQRDREGRTLALYWGRAFFYEMAEGRRTYRRYLAGPRLKRSAIYYYARRWEDREVFEDFDRRRLILNRVRSRLARLLRQARLRLTMRIARLPQEPPTFPPPLGIASEEALVFRLWQLSWACASVEMEMIAAVARARRSLPPCRLFPYATVGPDGYVAAGWAVPSVFTRGGRPLAGRRHLASRLSGRVLDELAVPRPLRAAFFELDRELRRLRREHRRHSARLGAIKGLGRSACRAQRRREAA